MPEHIKVRATALNSSTEILLADRTDMTSWWPQTEMLYPDSSYGTKHSNTHVLTEDTAGSDRLRSQQVRLTFTTCISTGQTEQCIWSKQGFKQTSGITLMPQWLNYFYQFHTQILLMSSTGTLAYFGLNWSWTEHQSKTKVLDYYTS